MKIEKQPRAVKSPALSVDSRRRHSCQRAGFPLTSRAMRVMAGAFLSLVVCVAAAQPRNAPIMSPQCSDDYVTIERVAGTIIEIKPAPEPFRSADIFMSGPAPCTHMWMQVLKADAIKCRIGDHVEAKGVITSDPQEAAWQINPEKNAYMLLNEDFTCAPLGSR